MSARDVRLQTSTKVYRGPCAVDCPGCDGRLLSVSGGQLLGCVPLGDCQGARKAIALLSVAQRRDRQPP